MWCSPRLALDDDARSYAPARIAPLPATVEHVCSTRAAGGAVGRLDRVLDDATAGRRRGSSGSCRNSETAGQSRGSVFSVEGGRVRGAIVRQDDDGQLPVEVVLDGPRLRLRIISPVPIPGDPAELPWLVLTPADDAFEGYWERASGGRLQPAIALRLVRATA